MSSSRRGATEIFLGHPFDPASSDPPAGSPLTWPLEKFPHMLISGRLCTGKSLLAKTVAAQWAMKGNPVVGWYEDDHFADSRKAESAIRELLTSAYGEGLSLPLLIVVDGFSSAPESLKELLRELQAAVAITGARFHLLVTDHSWARASRDPRFLDRFPLRCHLRPSTTRRDTVLPGAAEAIYDRDDFVAVLDARPRLKDYTYITLSSAEVFYRAVTFRG